MAVILPWLSLYLYQRMHKHRLLVITKGQIGNHSYIRYQNDSKTTSGIRIQKERNIRRKTVNGTPFTVVLFGYDGTEKRRWLYWPGWNAIARVVDTMPIRKQEINYSLYSDDSPNTTMKGLGFKNKQVAEQSIRKLQQSKLTSIEKKRIANTMIQRNQFHAHRTDDMKQSNLVWKQFYSSL